MGVNCHIFRSSKRIILKWRKSLSPCRLCKPSEEFSVWRRKNRDFKIGIPIIIFIVESIPTAMLNLHWFRSSNINILRIIIDQIIIRVVPSSKYQIISRHLWRITVGPCKVVHRPLFHPFIERIAGLYRISRFHYRCSCRIILFFDKIAAVRIEGQFVRWCRVFCDLAIHKVGHGSI